MSRLLEALHAGRVLLMDGAMGTELRRLGLGDHEPGEAWNLTHPDRVAAVHADYAAAGATVHLTNTFQMYKDRLPAAEGLGYSRLLTGCQTAARLAREATGSDALILCSLGPPFGPLQREFPDLAGVTVAVHLTRPVDGILLETCSTPRARLAVVRALQVAGNLPVLLSLTYRKDERNRPVTASGHPPEWFARRAAKWGVAALGVNCGRDISVSACAQIVRRYRDHTDLPVFARPNAGTPIRDGDQWVYPLTPRQMADELPELLEAGARMVGGCCGTTPAHVAALQAVVTDWDRGRAGRRRPG